MTDGDILAAVRAALPESRALYLFGSRADDGRARPDSDLDLAVLMPGRADPVRLWQAAQTIGIALGVDVDLVDLCAASTVLQYQAITGRRLFIAGSDAEIYESFILAEKGDLDLARAPLIADIMTEGHVHGR